MRDSSDAMLRCDTTLEGGSRLIGGIPWRGGIALSKDTELRCDTAVGRLSADWRRPIEGRD